MVAQILPLMNLSGTSTSAHSVAMSTRARERYPPVPRAGPRMWKRCQKDQESTMKKDQQQKPAKNVDEYLSVVLVDRLNDADPAKSQRL